jgi:hypothetical protein
LVERWNHNPYVRGSSPFSVNYKFYLIEKSYVNKTRHFGGYSSVVECLLVAQKVMGSKPVNHPQKFLRLLIGEVLFLTKGKSCFPRFS